MRNGREGSRKKFNFILKNHPFLKIQNTPILRTFTYTKSVLIVSNVHNTAQFPRWKIRRFEMDSLCTLRFSPPPFPSSTIFISSIRKNSHTNFLSNHQVTIWPLRCQKSNQPWSPYIDATLETYPFIVIISYKNWEEKKMRRHLLHLINCKDTHGRLVWNILFLFLFINVKYETSLITYELTPE